MTEPPPTSLSSLSTWEALCKDCRNLALGKALNGTKGKKAKGDLRQERYEYSDVHASRQFERGQSRSDRCPECRKRHKKEIAAFPVAYIDITAIGEAAKYVINKGVGPAGPLGGLGPLPATHRRRTEKVDLESFALGLKSSDIIELLDKLTKNDVVVLEAGTGTGKSTLAPFRLMNPPVGAPFRPTDVGPIIVTEPRVPATTEVARFVGEAMCFDHDPEKCSAHIGPGYPVGYQCEGKKVWDEACSLIYVTDGTMVNWITNGDLARIGMVIVDEAHERSENIDLILTLLAAQLPRYPHLRVIIASATIDKNYFMRFFEQTPSIRVGHHYVEAQKSIGYGVPLFADIDFTEDVLANGFTAADPANLGGEPRFMLPGWPDEPNPEEDDASLRALTRGKFLGLRAPAAKWPDGVQQAAVEQTMKILAATDHGDILVFLPNERMVKGARQEIEERIKDTAGLGDVSVYWLMRATLKAERDLALAPCMPGWRKVVVASNLAETSLTIAGIRYVVDSGLVIQAQWDPALAVSYAPLVAHSQSGIRQRWGRVGRKTHGWVFPLYTLQDFLQMPRDTPAGSTQTNLEGTILKLIAAGEDPLSAVFPADFVDDSVRRDSYAQASADSFTRERARALAALQTNGAVNQDGKSLTPLGLELTRTRLSSEKAIAVMFADRLACVPEVATALVTLAGREDNERNKGRLAGPGRVLASDPSWPAEWNVHARRCHEALAIGCIDDLDLVIRVFGGWQRAPDRSLWCAQWWVNEDVLVELSAAARKIMDSLSPNMSKEATRPLDPRLALRARAVFSRALGSLRYVGSGDGTWRSTNPSQPDPVRVSSERLCGASPDVIALVRERPNDSGAGLCIDQGEILGLVATYDWAAEGQPEDFELLRRASRRRAEAQIDNDMARHLRAVFPVGAQLRITPTDVAGIGRPLIQKLSDGLAKPTLAAKADVDKDAEVTVDAELIYTSETASSGDDLDDDQSHIAGIEVPEEEARLIPLPVSELETPGIEDFHGHERVSATAALHQWPGDIEPGIVVEGRVGDEDPAAPWCGVVIGYDITPQGADLVVEPAPETSPAARRVGDVVLRAVAIGTAATHFGPVIALRECDEDGVPVTGVPLYVAGSVLDVVVDQDADAIEPGSIWQCRVTAGRTQSAPTQISLADAAIERLTGSAAGRRRHDGTLAAVTAMLTGERYRDWRKQHYWIARLDPPIAAFTPRIAVRAANLETAGLAAEPGSRLKLDLRFDRYARRGGKWKPEDIERIVQESAGAFTAGKKPGLIEMTADGPLTEDDLSFLLDIDQADDTYERNAWQLWATSRKVGVRQVSAVGEAELDPAATRSLRATANLPALRRRYSVGVDIADTGLVSVTGRPEDVTAALGELKDAAVRPVTVVQIPGWPDGRYPKFPSKPDVAAAIAPAGPLADEVIGGYASSSGRLSLHGVLGDHAASLASCLAAIATYHCCQLTFADDRGFFAFQKKERWLALSSDLDGIGRWIVENRSAWGIFGTNAAAVTALLARIRAELPKVSFSVSTVDVRQPTVEQIEPLARQFEIGYLSPPLAAPSSAEAGPEISNLTAEQSANPPWVDDSQDEWNYDTEPDGAESATRGPALLRAARRWWRGDSSAPPATVLQHKDGCTVSDLRNGWYLVTGPNGQTVDVPEASYRADARPLHWLRAGEEERATLR